MYRVFIDGAANPTQQTSGVGILIVHQGEQIQISTPLEEYYDNHETEMIAFIEALQFLLDRKITEELILCHSDSKMLVTAIRKNYSKKENHRLLLKKILPLLSEFSNLHLKWIPEKENKGADQLAKAALLKAKKIRGT